MMLKDIFLEGPKIAPSAVASNRKQPLSGWEKAKAIAKSPGSWWRSRNWKPNKISNTPLPVAGKIEPASPAANKNVQQTPLPSISQLANDPNLTRPYDKPNIPGMPALPDFVKGDQGSDWFQPFQKDPERPIPSDDSQEKPELPKTIDMPSLAKAASQASAPTKKKRTSKKGKSADPAKSAASLEPPAIEPEMPSLSSVAPPEKKKPPMINIPALYSSGMKSKKGYGSWKVGDTVSLGKAGVGHVYDKIGDRFYIQKDDGRKYVFIPFHGMFAL